MLGSTLCFLFRQKIGYLHKKDEIDYSIARRVNKLYKILEHRFQSDEKIWMSHVDFLKRMVRVSSSSSFLFLFFKMSGFFLFSNGRMPWARFSVACCRFT